MIGPDSDSRDVSIAFLMWELVKAQREIRELRTDVKDYKSDNARIAAQWDRLRKQHP
jgi:hypothetical protein